MLLLYVVVIFSSIAQAETWEIKPTDNLQEKINLAKDGDTLLLSKGKYLGNFLVNKSITLFGDGDAILDAQGKDNALIIEASNVTIDNLTIVNWGDDLTAQNAGIYAHTQSTGLVFKNNTLEGDSFGIWLNKAENAKVINNKIKGNLALRSADRGNGIQLSSVKNSIIKYNETSEVRDGIYVVASQDNVIKENVMHDLRYGIHYMYSYDNDIINNYAYNTRAGYAMMSSRRLNIIGNRTENSEDYGFLLNYITQSTISKNHIKDVWTKPENKVLGRDGKGLFVYNSGYNTISYNVVDTAEIGIHLTAGSENVKIYGNSFLNNPNQVKYVSNKKQEWSKDKQGNYWSNYLGWDMNSDKVGDTIFEPNDGIDKLVWQYPEMRMLMDSPAVIILRWVQRQFPVLKPPGVKDSYPLMHPLPPQAPLSKEQLNAIPDLIKEISS